MIINCWKSAGYELENLSAIPWECVKMWEQLYYNPLAMKSHHNLGKNHPVSSRKSSKYEYGRMVWEASKRSVTGRMKSSTAYPSISDGEQRIFQWKWWGILSFLWRRRVNRYFTKKSEEPAQPYITSHKHSTICERSLQLDAHPSISTGEDAGKSRFRDGEE